MNGEDLLEGLVRIPSPTGREDAAVQYLQEQAWADGFRVVTDPVGNFVAEAGTGPRLLLFVGHVDTVPGDIPVRRDNGTLWGRGSVDAKGPLVAAYVAARRHLGDDRILIRVVGAVDEEGRSRGAKALPIDWDPSWIVIGEPSGADGVTLGYKGILRGSFTVARDRHHGAHPHPSAVEEAIQHWRRVEQRYAFSNHFHTIGGRLDSLETRSDGLRDVVEGRFNLRLPPGVDPAVLARELVDQGRGHEVRIEVEETVPGVEAPRRNELVAAFLATLRAHGRAPRLKRKTGTSDFNLFAQRHAGVPIVAYGPGDASLDHTPEERLEMAELHRAVDVLDGVFERLAGSS